MVTSDYSRQKFYITHAVYYDKMLQCEPTKFIFFVIIIIIL